MTKTEKITERITRLRNDFERIYGEHFSHDRTVSVKAFNDERFAKCQKTSFWDNRKTIVKNNKVIAYTDDAYQLFSYPFMEEYSHIPLSRDIETAGELWFYRDFAGPRSREIFEALLQFSPEVALRLSLIECLIKKRKPLAIIGFNAFVLNLDKFDKPKEGAFFIFMKNKDDARKLFFDIRAENILPYIRRGKSVEIPMNGSGRCPFGDGYFVRTNKGYCFVEKGKAYQHKYKSIMSIITEGIRKYTEFETERQESAYDDDWVLMDR